jgi:RTX calcium-binding nonapeptide repeat (4 copies)
MKIPRQRVAGVVAAFVLVAGVWSSSPAGGSTSAPTCFGQRATIVGTHGNDTLVGTSHRDVIVGLGGDDHIDGRGGADLLCGGPGADRIRGDSGDDQIRGGKGDDVLQGGPGNDHLWGQAGRDSLSGGPGDDWLVGGPVKAVDVSCQTGYAPAKPPALSVEPDPNIGQIGMRPPVVGHPAWDGDDRINDSAYVKATNVIYLVGEFDTYVWQGVTYPRRNAVAINATTGEPTAWAPDVDGEILAITASCTGKSLYIGGYFQHVNGVTRAYAARISPTTGSTFLWNPNPNSVVRDLTFGRRQLIVSGDFTTIGGATRTLIASVNGSTGAATSWLNLSVTGHEPEGPATISKFIVNHAGTYGVALGNFNRVNDRAHRRMFVLHLWASHPSLQTWDTQLTKSNHNANLGTDCSADKTNPELDAAWTPDDTRFGTASTGNANYGSICDTAAIWSASTDAMASRTNTPLAIQYTGGDTLSAILLTNTLGWATGHNRWANNPVRQPVVMVEPCSIQPRIVLGPGRAGYNCKGPGALDRPGMIAFTLSTMRATAWAPVRARQRAMHNTMFFTSLGMCIGSDGDDAAGEPHNDIVCFPFLPS